MYRSAALFVSTTYASNFGAISQSIELRKRNSKAQLNIINRVNIMLKDVLAETSVEVIENENECS